MELSYTEAVDLVEKEAQNNVLSTVTVSLYECCDRVVAETIRSPISTPQYDTSAMDGFALDSRMTENASPENPVTFQVMGTTTAGDKPYCAPDGVMIPSHSCVEIMTGAPFPISVSHTFDCCVPVEEVADWEPGCLSGRYISISKPAKHLQHRRFAGRDFMGGDRLLKRGERIQPQHVMAMASVAVEEIPVMRRPRVALFSTGCELKDKSRSSHLYTIPDTNGPYLSSMLRKWGVDVDFRGVVRDNQEAMEHAIETALDDDFDLIITTGAVSAGRCDIIPPLIKKIGGRTVFHKVSVKPGHPILFAMLLGPLARETAFFGLPGNPVAAAACLQFFVFRYLRQISAQKAEKPQQACLEVYDSRQEMAFRQAPDIFRPGIFEPSAGKVTIIEDYSPGKTKPFMGATCWVHIPRGVSEIRDGEEVHIYPLS